MEVPKNHGEARSTNVVRINDEIKNLFSQSAKSMIATAQNNMVIHVNPIDQQPSAPPQTGAPKSNDLKNVNFSNAVFKKNMLQTTTVAASSNYVSSSMPPENTNGFLDPLEHSAASMTLNDGYLSDDLAQMQIIDDKSLVDSLKAKFELKKYYVILILFFCFVSSLHNKIK